MRRGFTLVEILVALVVMVLVSSGVLVVFQYQNRNAIAQREVAEMNLMAKGLSGELSRTIRMAGGALPPQNGGLKVFGSGSERVVVALNRADGIDTTRAISYFSPGAVATDWGTFQNPLVLPVNHAANLFADSGYVLTTVRVPPASFASGTHPSPTRDTMIALPVLKIVVSGTVGGLSVGPLVIADGSWFASRWPWTNSVVTSANTWVYALDSVRYWMSNDTVFRGIDRNPAAAFAVGVDSMRLWYLDPVGGWLDSLYAPDTSREIDKVRIRLRLRTRHVDHVLAKGDPSSRGYRYQTIETEISLRNCATLSNR
jgi:prepilin-type N-terminal cleavage/methylation domain-containing protein